MKRFLPLLGRFVLFNLVVCAGCLAVELCLSFPLTLLTDAYELVDLFCGLGALALTPPAMYWVFFRYRASFHRRCKTDAAVGIPPHETADRLLKESAPLTLAMLILSVAAVTLIPARYVDPGNSAGSTGITTVMASARLWVYELPDLIFGSSTPLTRLPGALIWGALIAVFYVLLTRRSCRRFMTEGDTRKKTNVSALLIGTGLGFEVFFLLHTVLAAVVAQRYTELGAEDTQSWFIMLTGLLHIVVSMGLYLTEAIVAIVRQKSTFSVVKLICLASGGFILTNTLFYGTVETVIAMVCIAGITGLEIAALIRSRKVPAPPALTEDIPVCETPTDTE